MNYKIAICDDEDNCIKVIRYVIEDYFQDKKIMCEIDCFTSGNELLEKAYKFDIIFLDVEMEIVNGLEIKNQLSRLVDLRIIFVTNYEQYMSEAYGKNVVAYVNKTEINRIKDILNKIEIEDSEHKFINVNGREIDAYDIKYVKADGSYCDIYYNGTSSKLCVYLNELLERLPISFVRVHRSYIINLRFIRYINKNEILLKDNTIILISRRYKEIVLKRYFEYVRRRTGIA